MNAAAHMPGPGDILRRELPNGIVVLARENFAAESVVINGSLDVGSVFESQAQAGLANFTASALMRGTRDYTFDGLYEVLESLGARLWFSGNAYSTAFGGKALAEDLPTLLALAAQALRHPVFPVDQTERLRGEILNGLRIASQNTRAVANDEFRRLTYPADHPYSRTTAGTLESLRTLSLDDLRAFHGRHFGPRGMVVCVVGAIPAEEAVQVVEAAFGDWRNPDQPALPAAAAVPPVTELRESARVLPGKTQLDIVMGWVGPSRSAPDYHAANLGNNVLGVFGLMGRLGDVVREREGYAYSAGSRLGGGYGPGPWMVVTGVNPRHAHDAIRLIREEVRRFISEPISEEELADNQSNFTGRLPLALDSNEGVASVLLSMETYQLGLDYLLRYGDLINAITREDVLAAARHYLDSDRYTLAMAGPQVDGA